MTVNTTTINGFIVLPDDTVREKSSVIFTMTGFDTDADDNATVVPIPREAPIAVDGSIDIDLWPNPEGVRATFYRVTFSIYNGNKPYLVDGGLIEVPASGGPYDLNDLLPIAPPQGATVDEYIAQLAAAVAAAEAAADTAVAAAAPAQELVDNIRVTRDDFSELSDVTSGDLGIGEYVRIMSVGAIYQRVSSGGNLTSGLEWIVKPAASGYDPLAFGSVGDGATDDTVGLNAAYASGHAVATAEHAITGTVTIGAAVKGRLVLNLTASLSGVTPAVVVDGSVDDLVVNVPTSITARRVVTVNGHVGKLSVISVDQQNNRTAKTDAAVYQPGDGSSIGDVYVENFDNAFCAEDATDARSGQHLYKSYVRGGLWLDVTGYLRGPMTCHTKSANATTDPGHNGALYEGCHECTFGEENIRDAGEHGHRIGGSVGSRGTIGCRWGNVTVYDAGQCGVKVNDSSELARNISYGVIKAIDVKNSASASNKEALRLEVCKDFDCAGVFSSRQTAGKAAYGALYVAACERVAVPMLTINGSVGAAVYITDAFALDGTPGTGEVKDITVGFLRAAGLDSHVVEIECPDETFENVIVGGGYASDIGGDVVNVTANSPTGGIPNPVEITLSYHNLTGSDVVTNTTSGRLYTDLTLRN